MAIIYSAILRIISRNAKDPTSILHLALHTIDVLPFSRSRPDTQSRYRVQRESLHADKVKANINNNINWRK